MIRKLLIANRGEIACRIIKTAKNMGISTVAIYSDADRHAQHVKQADEAFYVGSSKSADSYLVIEKVIAAAKQSNADAIHPGYGFLSENTEFAKACNQNDIIFVGPPIEAIEAMGSKSTAKQIMEKANVPLVKGYHGDNQDEAFLLEEAKKIGFPVMAKATAGGGGKGMRIIQSENEFFDALLSAKREAKAHFSDDKMLIEKYVSKPRHIEIQVFADSHGNCVHLFERDCSIQRRHQKVIEEAPAPKLSDKLRPAIAEAAINAAKAIHYQGAGTVEFLLDEHDDFYFMEMNTRLQVEHPVTEMITGIDLVAWQILVASGAPLPKAQDEITQSGHSLEVRLYAEDPYNKFLPAIGKIDFLQWPQQDDSTRVDTGFVQEDSISPFYDPMLAKIIVWGETRKSAILKMQKALKELKVVGLKTNVEFLLKLVSQQDFIDINFDTGFIEKHHGELLSQEHHIDEKLVAIAALFHIQSQKQTFTGCIDPWSPWHAKDGWRANLMSQLSVSFNHGAEHYDCKIHFYKDCFHVQVNDSTHKINIMALEAQNISTEINNSIEHFTIVKNDFEFVLFSDKQQVTLTLFDPIAAADTSGNSANSMAAPMPGTIIDLAVNQGDSVSAGDKLVTMEAMKMEHSIYAPSDGIIKELLYQVGDMVDEGNELLIFEAEEA